MASRAARARTAARPVSCRRAGRVPYNKSQRWAPVAGRPPSVYPRQLFHRLDDVVHRGGASLARRVRDLRQEQGVR